MTRSRQAFRFGGVVVLALAAWLTAEQAAQAQSLRLPQKGGSTVRPPATTIKGGVPSLSGFGRYSIATPGDGIVTLYGKDPANPNGNQPQLPRQNQNLYPQPYPYGPTPYSTPFANPYQYPGMPLPYQQYPQLPYYNNMYSPFQPNPYQPFSPYGNPYGQPFGGFGPADLSAYGPGLGYRTPAFPTQDVFGGASAIPMPGLGYRGIGN